MKDNFFDNPKINSNIKSFSIGKTFNWEEIDCYSFWKWSEKILYFWWIHGNETGTVKLMNKWVNFVWEIESGTSFWNTQIFIIPCLNIDWYKQALKNPKYFSWWREGKTNAQDVDLNRNFPTFNWSPKSTLFAAGLYKEISWWTSPWSEWEIKALLNFIETEKVQTIYTFHNCWWTVFWRWTTSVNKKVKSYSKNSNYRVFADSEWDGLKPWQKTWQMMMWAEEKNIDVIEIEMKTRWWSEWELNKKALIKSLRI